MNLFHKIGLAVAASAALFAACSSDDDPFFARENDYLTFDCNEQTVEQSLQCDGAWSIDYDGNDDWIAVTPDSGVGNGELDFITVGVAYTGAASARVRSISISPDTPILSISRRAPATSPTEHSRRRARWCGVSRAISR